MAATAACDDMVDGSDAMIFDGSIALLLLLLTGIYSSLSKRGEKGFMLPCNMVVCFGAALFPGRKVMEKKLGSVFEESVVRRTSSPLILVRFIVTARKVIPRRNNS